MGQEQTDGGMMSLEWGGSIPSYKNVMAGEASRNGTTGSHGKRSKDTTVMGAHWQAGLGDKCLPRAAKKTRFVIPNNKLEEYRGFMKDHALICKFIGAWPTKKELVKWIQHRW